MSLEITLQIPDFEIFPSVTNICIVDFKRAFHELGSTVDGLAIIREWSQRNGWRYSLEGPWYFEAWGDKIVPTKSKSNKIES
jgi:hypothetical protein